jgi:hypothetical protein
MYRLTMNQSAKADPERSGKHFTFHLSPRLYKTFCSFLGEKGMGGTSFPQRPVRLFSPKSKISSSISKSTLRPHVFAHQRVSSWKTSHGIHFRAKLASFFTPKAIAAFEHVISASVEQDTRRNYGAGLLHFTQFCDRFNIPECLRMPASEHLLAMFVSISGAGHVSPDTITSWLSGLQMWHAYNGATWTAGPILRRVTSGATKLAPQSSLRPPREPVTFNHMLILRQHLHLSNSRDAAIWAVVSVAFKTCSRLGELVPKSSAVFHPSCNVTRGGTVQRGHAANGRAFIQFKIPCTKTNGTRGDWINASSTTNPLDPVSALEHHLFITNTIPAHTPLFAFRTLSGWSSLNRSDVMSRCQQIWEMNGVQHIHGHGFRIAGTTYLLLCGVDPWVIMKLGRWSSKAFLRYWRKIEAILPLFLPNSSPSLSSIRKSITHIAASCNSV